MIRARPVTFAGGLLLEDAPEEQKKKKKLCRGGKRRERGDRERERYPGTGQGGKKVEVMIKS